MLNFHEPNRLRPPADDQSIGLAVYLTYAELMQRIIGINLAPPDGPPATNMCLKRVSVSMAPGAHANWDSCNWQLDFG